MSHVDDLLQEVLRKKAQTELDDLLEFYTLCARARGNSEKTIAHTTTVIRLLSDYLSNQRLPTNALEIDHRQIRGFILDLQQRSRFARHPYAKPAASHNWWKFDLAIYYPCVPSQSILLSNQCFL